MIPVINPNDSWCLARAILIGLKFIENGEQRTPEFLSFCANQEGHSNAARQLLVDAGVSETKEEYGIPDAKKIQRLINDRYGNDQIRRVIFAHQLNNRLAWKGWMDRPAAHNLCLFNEKAHFAFVGYPQQLLKVIIC